MYLYWQLFQSGELILNDKIKFSTLSLSLISAYVLWVSINAQFPTSYRLSFVLFIIAMTTLVFKPSIKQMFPAFFLVFLVPVWGSLTALLQSISTYAVTYMMNLTNIPIFVEGNTISIPAGVFEIAGGCSGLRYLIVSLAISTLFIFLNIRKYSHAATFLSLAIIGALITNWLRITILILVGHYTEMQSSLMHDHNSFGWYLYIPFMIGLFYFGRRYTLSLPEKVTHPYEKKKISYNLYLSLALIFLVSSSPTMLLQPDSDEYSNCDTIVPNLPQPQLYSPPTNCQYILENSHIVTYTYSGLRLEQSVDNYLNKFVPKNWRITNSYQNEFENIILIENQRQKLKVSYSFVSGKKATSDLSVLKKLKLINALTGNSDTSLIWKMQECNTECMKLFNQEQI